MEILTTLFLFLAALAIIAYGVITETTDWVGRAEIIEQRWPGLWGLMNNRPMRLILLVVALVMVGHVIQDLHAGAEPVQVRFDSPKVPTLASAAAAPQEPADSLRRRTIRLADALYDYIDTRRKNHPPYAYPQPNDPNPSEEQKKKIKVCAEYDDATSAYYAKHFRDQMVGLIREYNAKGVRTAWLESSATSGNLAIAPQGAPWEGSRLDDLSQFRDLAYHVDARDQLITF